MQETINFGKIYKNTVHNFKCLADCRICEDRFLQFLPGEAEYLSTKYKIPRCKLANKHKINGKVVWMIENDEKDCNFYKCGRCIKREIRSLDCRTYPVIPFLKNKKLSVKLDTKCPVAKEGKIPDYFIKKCLKSWKEANPPGWWMKIYKKNLS